MDDNKRIVPAVTVAMTSTASNLADGDQNDENQVVVLFAWRDVAL